jgi:hypothetical protein
MTRIIVALVLGGLVAACGSNSGRCGSANEECCVDAGTVTTSCNVSPDLPNPKALTCQRFTNGAYYCLPCGYEGEACCSGANGDVCVAGLTCVAPYPGATTGGICQPS